MANDAARILIVEDENIIAKDIRRTILKLGYQVTRIVGNGRDAIQSTEEDLPDLILMDIILKGDLTGIDASEEIRKMYNIPIVYLTALTDDETMHKAKVTEPFGFLLKPFDQRELHTAIEIALYKNKMEIAFKKRTRELEEEKKKNDNLLHHILPSEIVKELKQNGQIVPRQYEMITISFTNFHRFSDISSKLPPYILVRELNEIFNKFDTITEEYGLEKLKTIGDTYMIGGGLPKETEDHAVKIIKAALDMQQFIAERNQNSEIKWILKTGVHSGQVVAGIVGTNKFTYDIWGDSVNIASRMESSCEPGKINISGFTYELIKEQFNCDYRGKLNAKGKGEIDMYFVKDVKNPVLV